MRSPPRFARALRLGAAIAAISCGSSSVPSPFVEPDAGTSADAAADSPMDAPILVDSAPDADLFLGGPCLDDEQCDDEVDCTFDECDADLSRCRFVPDDGRCQNDLYCDGVEVCHPKLGCLGGDPVACSDEDTCTIDECVEADKSCKHEPRDADGDGDPDWNCQGADCNDSDPTVSSLAAEVCLNGRDDDCDGEADEAECVSPEHDTCIDPLEIAAPGTYEIATLAARQDYAATCAGTGGGWRDVVVALVLPPGSAVDVDLFAESLSGNISLASASLCGDPSTELTCAESNQKPTGGESARLRLRSLAPGTYPVIVFTDSAQPLSLSVDFLPPSSPPINETCGTAADVAIGENVRVELVDPAKDLTSACTTALGELVYRFTLAQTRDVDVFATSLDGRGTPSLSLRSTPCVALEDEVTCQTAQTAAVFARALAPGTHFLAVSASNATDVDFVVETSPPSAAPADETCDAPPAIVPDQTLLLTLEGHVDDPGLGCLGGARDAAYELAIAQRSDVLLIERISSDDTGAVGLAVEPCASSADVLACHFSSRSPIRAIAHDVESGSYRAVVESLSASPVTLSALTRPASPPTFVAFADVCDEAIEIPPTGGFFQGNTANSNADYSSSCDLGGQGPGGAEEQMLRFTLTETRRVVLDMQGSSYSTLLQVRRGPACPGQDLLQACAAGFLPDKSFLDLTLPAGEYFVQIDGYNGDSGAWQLDAFFGAP